MAIGPGPTTTMNLVRWPFLYMGSNVNRFRAKWPPPISKTTSIQLNFEKPQTMLNELRLKIYQYICVGKSPVNAWSKNRSGLNYKASTVHQVRFATPNSKTGFSLNPWTPKKVDRFLHDIFFIDHCFITSNTIYVIYVIHSQLTAVIFQAY